MPPAEIFERDGHRVGHGEREFQIVGVGRLRRRRSSRDGSTPSTAAFAADRGADDAGGQDVAPAVAAAELAVVHHVAGQHRLAVAHHGRGQERRDAVIAMRRVAPRGNDFEFVALAFAGAVARPQQHRAGVDLRAFEQAVERRVGERDDVGRLGQFEREPAELRRGAADLRERARRSSSLAVRRGSGFAPGDA